MRLSSFPTIILMLIVSAAFAFAGHGPASPPAEEIPAGHVMINFSGMITDSHQEPVNEAEVSVFAGTTLAGADTTGHGGKYLARFAFPEERIADTVFNVIVRKQETADDGDIVVALIGSEATLKRFRREHGRVRLEPANHVSRDRLGRRRSLLRPDERRAPSIGELLAVAVIGGDD